MRFFPITAFLICLLSMTGCGYSLGARYPQNVRTIQIDIAERWPLAARGMEFDLTEAVAREASSRYGVTLSNSGDAVFEIGIIGYKVWGANTLTQAEGASLSLTITINVKVYITKADGEPDVIFDDKLVHNEPFSLSGEDSETSAQKRAIQRLAPKIADCLVQW